MNTATGGLVMRGRQDAFVGEHATHGARATAACLAVCVLLLAVPFETVTPLLVWAGQSVSSSEAVLLVGCSAWLLAGLRSGDRLTWRTPLTTPWLLLLAVSIGAAMLAPAFRDNALNMSMRLAMAFAVFLMTVDAVRTWDRLRIVCLLAATSGVLLSALVIADFIGISQIRELLSAFRPSLTVVGAHVRPSGPFHYPTIASMYLEILFALSLPLAVLAFDRRRRLLAVMLAVVALLIAEASLLTFTRAGLVTIVMTIAWLAFCRLRSVGLDRIVIAHGVLAFVVVGLFLSSRPAESMTLRLTSEGQDTWYAAAIQAPARVHLATGETAAVALTLTNTGSVTWDSSLPQPFRVSYHWLTADGSKVVSWEGRRTLFPSPVRPGDRVTLQVDVGAPRSPGEYRLMWDIEQEHRLWFSTEPGAGAFSSSAVVSGPPLGPAAPLTPLPLPLQQATVRPGRLMLWQAAAQMVVDHPLLGVGPDNYRLHYGRYLQIAQPDTRIHSNNMYLEVLTGSGLLGASAFAMFAGSAALLAIRARQRVEQRATVPWDSTSGDARVLVPGVIAAALAVAMHGVVDSFLSFTATYVLIAITLGLLVACAALSKEHAYRL
jgi:hypothetical protein